MLMTVELNTEFFIYYLYAKLQIYQVELEILKKWIINIKY